MWMNLLCAPVAPLHSLRVRGDGNEAHLSGRINGRQNLYSIPCIYLYKRSQFQYNKKPFFKQRPFLVEARPKHISKYYSQLAHSTHLVDGVWWCRCNNDHVAFPAVKQKNRILYMRSRRSFPTRTISSLLFLAMLACIDKVAEIAQLNVRSC